MKRAGRSLWGGGRAQPGACGLPLEAYRFRGMKCELLLQADVSNVGPTRELSKSPGWSDAGF